MIEEKKLQHENLELISSKKRSRLNAKIFPRIREIKNSKKILNEISVSRMTRETISLKFQNKTKN